MFYNSYSPVLVCIHLSMFKNLILFTCVGLLILATVSGQTVSLVKIEVTAARSEKDRGYTFPPHEAIQLHYKIYGENLASIDKASLWTSDKPSLNNMWKLGRYSVRSDGTQAQFTILKNGEFLHKVDAVKVSGSIKLWTAAETKELIQKVVVDGDSETLGLYSIEAKTIRASSGVDMTELKVGGNQKFMKDVRVTKSGKRLHMKWSSNKKESKILAFDKVDGEIKVAITYWAKLTKMKVNFSK